MLRWTIAATSCLALAILTLSADPGLPFHFGARATGAGAPAGAACPANAKAANLNFTLKDVDNKDVQLSSFKGKVVLLDFWATWCGPCKLVAPEMEKIAAKYEGAIDVVKVDVDANPGLSRAFNIMSIPTIAFFAPGKQPMGVVGFRPMEQLETQFNLGSFPKVAAEAAASTDADSSTTAASDAA